MKNIRNLNFIWEYSIGRAIHNNIDILNEVYLANENFKIDKLFIIQIGCCIEAILLDFTKRLNEERNERNLSDFHYIECFRKDYGKLKIKKFKLIIDLLKKHRIVGIEEDVYNNLHKVRVLRNWTHFSDEYNEKKEFFPEYNEEKKVLYHLHKEDALETLRNLIYYLNMEHSRPSGKSNFKFNFEVLN